MVIQFTIFLTIFQLIIASAHWGIYYSLIRFFQPSSPILKQVLFGGLMFLAVSFLLSTLLAHFNENILTRGYYWLSAFWLGWGWYIMLAMIAAWVIYGLAKLTGLNLDMKIISLVLLTLSLTYSFYGVYNAGRPQIKNVSVHLPNLPEAWKNRNLVQLSDIHLGHINRGKFMERVVNQVNALEPEAVVITGDLFDGMDGDLETMVLSLNKIKAVRETFFITGNHEVYLKLERSLKAIKATPVKILDNQLVDWDGLQIIGLSYSEREAAGALKNTISSLLGFDPNKAAIVLKHVPTRLSELAESGIDLVLSGHTHKGQIWPFGYLTEKIFKGYDYGLKTFSQMQVYTTSGVGTWGPPMRTGNKPEIVNITFN